MKTLSWIFIALCLISARAASAADSINEALQQGLFEEEANHNLEAAIRAYQTVIKRYEEQNKLAATAIYRLGECYRKLGRTNDAIAQYQLLLRQFPGELTLGNLSRQNLAGMSVAMTETNRSATGSELGSSIQEDLEIRRIAAMIRNSPDLINAQGDAGPPLYDAAVKGQLAVAKYLLEHGADVNARKSSGLYTPLHGAATQGHKAMVELLIRHGANLNLQNQWGYTPLHVAVSQRFVSVTAVLLAAGADPNVSTFKGAGFDGGRSLHSGVSSGNTQLCDLLIQHKADVNGMDENGKTPLSWLVELSLQAGGRANQRPRLGLSGGDRLAMATYLLDHGAAVNQVGSQELFLLHDAVANWDVPMVNLLLKRGAEVNARRRGEAVLSKGDSPLKIALSMNRPADIVQALLEGGASPNEDFSDGSTPLNTAIGNGNVESVIRLLEHGAQLEARGRGVGPQPTTPLQTALAAGKTNIAKLLLKAGADINAEYPEVFTALHAAAAEGSLERVAFLLENKANPNARNKERRTPLHLAAMQRFKEISELLIEHGADLNALDIENKTPLNLATGTSPPSISLHDPSGLIPGGTLVFNNPNWQFGGVPVPPAPAGRPSSSPIKPEEYAGLLRERGAEEMPLRDAYLWLRRSVGEIGGSKKWDPLATPWLQRGTNLYNRHSLLELIASFYLVGEKWPFPDWSRVTIERSPTTEAGKEKGKPAAETTKLRMNLSDILASETCSNNVWLEWGDVVGIPEADHPLSVQWTGLDAEVWKGLEKCLRRQVTFVVKDEAYPVVLLPGVKESGAASYQPRRTIPARTITQPASPPAPQAKTATSSSNIFELRLPFFHLSTAVREANVLRASSDLSRVTVLHHDPFGKGVVELRFNLEANTAIAEELWLRDGDVVVIPEKGLPLDLAKAKELVKNAARALEKF